MPHLHPPIYDQVAMEPGEIYLFNTRFPITGAVRRRSATPFAQKLTIGDYSKDDMIVQSSWVLSDFSGGLGVSNARPNRDDDRYQIGDLEARYRFLTLGAEVVTASTGLTPPVLAFQDFNDALFAVTSAAVFSWTEATATWTSVQAISGTFRSICVFDGSMYTLTSTTLYRYSPNDSTPWSSIAVGGYALASFDDKLWRLDTANGINWAVHTGSYPTQTLGSWTSAGRLQVPVGHCGQLIVYFDQTGTNALHAVTRIGLLGYDFDTQRFYKTPLEHPYSPAAGRGACVWRGALYVPVDSSILKYTGTLISAVGPDGDEGLPFSLQGDVVQVVPGNAFLFAVVNAAVSSSSAATNPMTSGFDAYSGTFVESHWPDGFFAMSANGSVFVTPERAWHMVEQHLGITSMNCAIVAGLSDSYRLWFSDSGGVFYLDQPRGLHNPLSNPLKRYREDGFLYTPWQDLRWPSMDKMGLSMEVEAAQLSATETVRVSAAYDDDDTFENVTGDIDGGGENHFHIGGIEGQRFRNVKLLIEMERDPANPARTPILKAISFGFMRQPHVLDAWEVEVDLTPERCEMMGVTAGELITTLMDLKRNRRAGLFTYRDIGQEPRTRRVWIAEVAGAEEAAALSGRYGVTLLELDAVESDS